LDRYERLERTRRKPERKTDLQNLRQLYNPQKVWSEYKSGILAVSTRATQQRRVEITKIRRETEREIKRAERNLRDCEQEEEEKFRETLSKCKKTLSDYDEEARNVQMNLNEARWFKDNESGSKQWFSLNKTRAANTAIKSLLKGNTDVETEDPEEMLEIARSYHSQLQGEQQMNEGWEKAITEILAEISKKISEDESVDIEKEVSFKEVYGAIRKAPNGKAPGPDGIPNEFWKIEMKWQEKMKEERKHQPGVKKGKEDQMRPCIAALMTKVLQDIEVYSPADGHFSEARMGLLYKIKEI
jgi:hypothetical protein